MAFHLWKRTTPAQAWTEVDVSNEGIGMHDVVHTVEAGMPATLNFKVFQPQHETPFGYRDLIKWYDDSLGYTATNPQFIGHIFEMNPGDGTNVVTVMCSDPTRRAVEEVPVMSGAWGSGSGSGSGPFAPVEGTNVYPRLVLNTSIENDDDFAYCRIFDSNVRDLIKLLFDDAYTYLTWLGAAPMGSPAYEPADLDSFHFIPQEKVVFESANLKRALSQLMAWYPKWRFMFVPNTLKWRFFDLSTAAPVTLTLNDPTAPNVVLSGRVMRSTQNRATAVKFYGPERPILDYVETATGSGFIGGLSPVDFLEVETCGGVDLIANRSYQVNDTSKRKLARLLPETVQVQDGPLTFMLHRAPFLQAWYSGEDGLTNPQVIFEVSLDTQNGKVFAPNWVTLYDATPGSGCYNKIPYNVRFTFAYLGSPFSARHPTSGYGGTAYTEAGLELEMRIYDDMLAIGWENHYPITSSGRIEQFRKLAEAYHDGYSDIIYTGMIVLEGIDVRFMRLHRRVNVAAVDADGNTITTGWESAGMWVTGVEYDYENNLTTLTLSGDYLQLFQLDDAVMKAQLKIKALNANKVQGFKMTTIRNDNGSLTVISEFTNDLVFTDEQGNAVDVGGIIR